MPTGTRLPTEDHLRRLRAYEETSCDREAAQWLGMDVIQYTSWRRQKKLPTKPAPKTGPKTRTIAVNAPKYLVEAVKEAARDAGVNTAFFVRAILIDWHAKQEGETDV